MRRAGQGTKKSYFIGQYEIASKSKLIYLEKVIKILVFDFSFVNVSKASEIISDAKIKPRKLRGKGNLND